MAVVDATCSKHGDVKHHRGADQRTRCAVCMAEYVRKHQRRVKAALVAERGGACERCGYSKCLGSLHFHHRDPATKSFKVGSGNKSLDRQRAEAEKCDLICANCHGEEHWSE